MKPGDVVEMKSAVVQFGGEKVRGSATMKALAGRHMAFLFLGGIDLKNREAFSPRDVLKAMGWIPGPDLQAEFDEDAKQLAAHGVQP